MEYKNPILIAEVGCNHKGDFDVATRFIEVAADFCNLKYIKFQKRDNKNLLSKEEYNMSHPVPENSYGNTYGEHRDFLEFDVDQHKELISECTKKNMTYSSSVWDLNSAKDITNLKPDFIKVGSATNLNFKVLDYLCENYKGIIHLSLGMTTKLEEEKIVNFFKSKNRNKDLVLYACTSAYPVDPKNVCLLEVKRLVEKYKKNKTVLDIGFSGHHKGVSCDMAAYTLGANYIERHFTLDRTWKGTDHAASLEPDGMRRLDRDLKNLFLGLRYKSQDILEIEESSRKKLKKIF